MLTANQNKILDLCKASPNEWVNIPKGKWRTALNLIRDRYVDASDDRKQIKYREPVAWTDPGGCSTCKYCGMDMDMDPYCVHPTVVEKHPYGVNINTALKNFCRKNGVLKLREERQP